MPSFVVQEHHSRRLHWDFRLEVAGTLKSWAVPKGPSLDPHERRFAIRTPDHSLGWAKFEGEIPAGSYGAGEVVLWDEGEYHPLKPQDPEEGLRKGILIFRMSGHRLKGVFALVKLRGVPKKDAWILIKKCDVFARTGWRIPILSDGFQTRLKKAA